MNHKTLIIYAALCISMLSAATMHKGDFRRLPTYEQTQFALPTPPDARSPEGVLLAMGNYPRIWDCFPVKKMFDIFDFRSKNDVNLLKQWICAIYMRFDSPDFQAISYARAIHILAKYTNRYTNRGIAYITDAFIDVWSKKAPIQEFNAQEITNCLWAFANLDKPAPDALLQSITCENIQYFNAQGISNCLWAFARLNKPAPTVLLRAINEGNIQSFKPFEIFICLKAFSKMNIRAPNILLYAITDRNIQKFSFIDISGSLLAFAEMGKRPPNALLQAITCENIKSFNAQSITESLLAFAKLGKPAPNVLLRAITCENIQYFTVQRISNCLWAFAEMGKRPPNVLLQAVKE